MIVGVDVLVDADLVGTTGAVEVGFCGWDDVRVATGLMGTGRAQDLVRLRTKGLPGVPSPQAPGE